MGVRAAGVGALVCGALASPLSWPAVAAQEEGCQPGVSAYVDQPPSVIGELGLAEAWNLSTGGALVAVVDSGVDARNPHFEGALVPGADFVDGGDGTIDNSGHGTAVAGQIAARRVPGSGVIGVAPQSVIMPVRVYDDASDQAIRDGRGPTAVRTAQGIMWAADNGAAIIVVPQSTESDVPVLKDAVAHATAAGSLIVASAGNAAQDRDGAAVRFPAGYPDVLSVTAVDSQGLPSDQVIHGVHVEIAAPGSGVLTTFFNAGDCLLAPQSPSTSYATGYVGGIAALVASAYPHETPADWEYRLLVTALRPTQTARDNLIGWGIVAPWDALNFVNDGSAKGPANPRFPPPVEQVQQIMRRPDPVVDPVPQRTVLVSVVAMGGIAILVTALLVARLRDKP